MDVKIVFHNERVTFSSRLVSLCHPLLLPSQKLRIEGKSAILNSTFSGILVIIARTATFLSPILLASFLTASSLALLGVRPTVAAPSGASRQAAVASSALTFDITARVGTSGQFAGPQQTVQARILLRGNAARIETASAGTPAVVLFSPPYVYRLLPASKAGVRWKLGNPSTSNFADFDPQTFLRDPSKLKGELVKSGAKRTGGGVLDKAPVDIYEARDFKSKGQRVKVWLRKADSLPLRLEASGGQYKITASWRNYARPKSLPAALFAAPKGFRVREVQGQPPFSVL
jgi:hypothetical protein